MSEVEKLITLTGESDKTLLSLLLDESKDFVLAYTKLIDPLKKPVRDLAVIAYNRRGTEGENSRSGGGESYSFDNAPKQIYDVLNRYRLARVGGVIHEAKAESPEDISS